MNRRFFEPFASFEFRIEPGEHEVSPLYDAVGAVALAFAELEDEVSLACTRMLGVAENIADTVTCEMSFKNKLHLLASLFRQRAAEPSAVWGVGDRSVQAFDELMANCFEAEQLRNTILHSSYVYPVQADNSIKRRKTTAKSKGLRTNEVVETPASLLRIAVFTVGTAEDLSLFFFNDARPA